MNFDWAIVGGGLAACMIADKMQENGIRVKLFAGNRNGEASAVSSGIIKPITGRRWVKSWMFDTLQSCASQVYHDYQNDFKLHLIKNIDFVIELNTILQENEWNTRMLDPEYDSYMKWVDSSHPASNFWKSGSRYGLMEGGMQIDIPNLVDQLRNKLQVRDILLNQECFNGDIEKFNQKYLIHGFQFDRVLFCEGFRILDNSLFNLLPIYSLKGEAQDINISEDMDYIFQSDYSLVPKGDHTVWIGSNYNLKDKTLGVTDVEIKRQLEFVKFYFPAAKHLKSHFGFRCTTKDRRPIVGKISQSNEFYVMNGFGTKGASQIPFASLQFMDFILHGKKIHPELDVNRLFAS